MDETGIFNHHLCNQTQALLDVITAEDQSSSHYLSLEERSFLHSIPPHVSNWEELVEKHYGDEVQPESAYDYMKDVQQLHRNLALISRMKKKSNEDCINHSVKPANATTIKPTTIRIVEECNNCSTINTALYAMEQHIFAASSSAMDVEYHFGQLQRELNGNRDIFVSDNILNALLRHVNELRHEIKHLKLIVENK